MFIKNLNKLLVSFVMNICLYISAIFVQAGTVINESGDLSDHLSNGIILPGSTSSSKYRAPTEAELDNFGEALSLILQGDYTGAVDFANMANYDLISYMDTVSSDQFILLREMQPPSHYGGIYVIDTSPERALVVQSPHPLHDGARDESVDFFMRTDAVAFMMAGTHRNNSPIEVGCDGTQSNGLPYRISDMAHAVGSFYQLAHDITESYYKTTVALNFHGMADSQSPSNVVISNGVTHDFAGNSLSRNLVDRMNEILTSNSDGRSAVSHQEPIENPVLSGNTNTQGRATNGSTFPCTVEAPTAIYPERFIHMEMDRGIRSGDLSDQDFVVQTFNELIPLFSDPIPELPTGDIIITEFMAHPDQVSDSLGEYIELFNNSGQVIDMSGWQIFDRTGNVATISGIIQPGVLFVLGRSADLNGAAEGGAPDAVWMDTVNPDFSTVDQNVTITNTGDVISIIDENGDLIASVAYEEEDLPSAGVAMELKVGNQSVNGQTNAQDYQASTTVFGDDWGSPGALGSTVFPITESLLDIVIEPANTNLNISFLTQPSVTYKLEKSDNLHMWSLVPETNSVIGDGENYQFSIPQPSFPKEFYRLEMDYVNLPNSL